MQPILRTRTTIPPTRLRQVYRQRLLAKVSEGTQRALTLIVAPAGFGKTCLTADWAQSGILPVAWLSLQVTDGQSLPFFTYLIQALQTIDSRIGQSSTILMQSGDFEAALYSLANDISSVDIDFALVLDDYHNAQGVETNQILQFLLDNRPNGFHLILLSRMVPELSLARLRASDQVVEIGSRELRFTIEEEKLFLEDIMGLHLPEETRLKLDQTTEGWPVGLQLAAIALAQNPSDQAILGDQQHIFEYLADEVLKREPVEVQELLKRTSLFDRFCLPMIDYIYSDTDCAADDCRTSTSRLQELIGHIERSNLFLVQLDSNWYRYHSLFSDFLRPLVSREHQTHLYSSASRWMERNELYLDAVHYAIHAGELSRAASLLENRYLGMLQMGEQSLLREIISDFPDSFLDDHPRLWLARAWTYVISMDPSISAACIERSEQNAQRLGTLITIQNELVCLKVITRIFSGSYADISEIQVVLERLKEDDAFLTGLAYFSLGLHYVISGNTTGVLDTLQQALEREDINHNTLVAIFSRTQLGETRQIRGALGLAERTFQEAIRYTQDTVGEHSLLVGLPYISYSELLREENRLDEALRYARQGIAFCQVWQPVTGIDGLITLARILGAQHQWDEASEVFERALRITHGSKSVLDDWIVAVHMARLALIQGDTIKARNIIRFYNLEHPESERYYIVWEQTRLVILRSQLIEANSDPAMLSVCLDELKRIQTTAEENERMNIRVECLVLRSYIYHNLQNHDAAIETLSQAVSICAQCGYLRILLDEGARLLHLLRQYRSQMHVPFAYMEQLLLLLTTENAPKQLHRRVEDGLSPLTRREIDILNQLAAGKSNQQIALDSMLTLNTVKKHVANILSKLGVANRTQAVLLARRSGWIIEKITL